VSGSYAPPSAGGGGATTWATPGAIGSTTPSTGNFTTLTQSGPLITTVSATQTITATNTIAANAAVVAVSSASGITMTSNPQLGTGANGQRIVITNVGSNGITFVNGNGLILPQNIPLYGGKSLPLTFYSAYSSWVYDGIILESLALTGAPTAPTAGAGTSSTQIATTAFVEGAVNPTWSAFTFQNTFSNQGGTFQTCRFAKVRGIVYLQGMATRAIAGFTSGMVVATLPTGNRPAATIRFPSGDTFFTPGSLIDIDSAGNITLSYNGTPTTILQNFNHISFVAP
jgi:hypothetical protein